jgi:hypothetical protein
MLELTATYADRWNGFYSEQGTENRVERIPACGPVATPLALRWGVVIDRGTHDESLGRCELYRWIFARYDWGRRTR